MRVFFDYSPDMATPLETYNRLLVAGNVKPDEAQQAVVRYLDDLYHVLCTHMRFAQGLRLLFKKPIAPRGVYIHGDVGRGKSMLMDLFFDSIPFIQKRRVHFHEFMQEIHDRIYQYRQENKGCKVHDPIVSIAKDMRRDVILLCFDEFQVKDIADASLLGRLFTALMNHHIVIVMTSNRIPDDLYKGGLNRQRFLPFIDLIKEKMDVLFLDSIVDYRFNEVGGYPVWFHPLNEETRMNMEHSFLRLTGDKDIQSHYIMVKRRKVFVPRMVQGVARFSFIDLCGINLGVIDYLAVAQSFHTVFIEDIPVLSVGNRNEALRFIHLIDVFYEHKIKIIISCETTPERLYQGRGGVFEFQRTVSRLQEMQSEKYMRNQ